MDGGVGWLPHHLSFRGEELKRKVMGILWEPSNLVRDLLHRGWESFTASAVGAPKNPRSRKVVMNYI